MKKVIKSFIFPLSILCISLVFTSCIINNPQPEECRIVKTTIIEIEEGTSFDIVFHDNVGDRYYVNRGLEQGLNLDDLNASVLNKTVTLHLAKVLGGIITSEHISQLAIGDEIFFTEFD